MVVINAWFKLREKKCFKFLTQNIHLKNTSQDKKKLLSVGRIKIKAVSHEKLPEFHKKLFCKICDRFELVGKENINSQRHFGEHNHKVRTQTYFVDIVSLILIEKLILIP